MVEQLLDLTRATRTGNWDLHLTVVKEITPWFFSYDHMNYARYLPVYLTEMADIPNSHHQTSLDLPRNWSVQRQTKYPFSQMACDQTIENKLK